MYIEETKLLDYSHPAIQKLIRKRGWRELDERAKITSVYNFVRDEIKFGFNSTVKVRASALLLRGVGHCNTKGILFMALLRALGIPCRMHAFYIDKRLHQGIIPGLFYRWAPEKILHTWTEVFSDGCWYQLEGIILDKAYLAGLQHTFEDQEGVFVGYGVGVKDFRHPVIDFAGNNTYIQSTGIIEDLGIFAEPDMLFHEMRQEWSPATEFFFVNFCKNFMNRRVEKIRQSVRPGELTQLVR